MVLSPPPPLCNLAACLGRRGGGGECGLYPNYVGHC